MVTNLPAEAKAKWAQVVACRSTQEKIKLMREFLSLVPKHKGTSRLVANVKRRIAELERELEESKARRKGGGVGFALPKEGAGQIVILGPPNVGKSSLLASVTNAKPEISPIPFTTQRPIPGMLQYQDIQFQLVEAPAIVEGASEGRMGGTQVLGLARNADGLIVMVDLSEDPVKQISMVLSELDKAGIMVKKPEGEVEIIRRPYGSGIQIINHGVLVDCTHEDIRDLLSSYRITSALVKISGKVSLDDVEAALFSNSVYRPTVIIANKSDLPNSKENIALLKDYLDAEWQGLPLLVVSCLRNEGLKDLGKILFGMLEIIRVYTKEPSSKEPSERPLIVKKGTSVIDVAKKLHSEIYKGFKYARIWGPSAKYPGERVGPSHILMDGDIVEIHC
ncbi:50S ribosome-binding GTPase [Candidatus Bathyarchaeota archaeon]|nr:50S ribosome-binding GTPase [Candidatus Bathyarchaeota archaeon]